VTPTFKTDVGAGQFSWTGIRFAPLTPFTCPSTLNNPPSLATSLLSSSRHTVQADHAPSRLGPCLPVLPSESYRSFPPSFPPSQVIQPEGRHGELSGSAPPAGCRPSSLLAAQREVPADFKHSPLPRARRLRTGSEAAARVERRRRPESPARAAGSSPLRAAAAAAPGPPRLRSRRAAPGGAARRYVIPVV
jgi:hypothetical protein